MNEAVIECENLTHFYGKRKIYENLNFTVPKGRIMGLLGKNGTGKTTTINILMGYLQPRGRECRIFGENILNMSPEKRKRIALLLENHVQYTFMNIEQIEKYYGAFYPNWNKDAYYELMAKLKVAPKQLISRMSCGQRSQVALGLILAQNADLLVLDDFSIGLDPGYRRLFIEYLEDYTKSEDKTVFMTSHIIQDLDGLVDDCIVMDYGKILLQKPISELKKNFKTFTFEVADQSVKLPNDPEFYHPGFVKGLGEINTFKEAEYVKKVLDDHSITYTNFKRKTITLEDAFVGLTGKY
ncbi:MAG: ABC transporter ATP-binding protein [Bacteroidales bacterium]